MRAHHRIPTVFNIYMLDVICCALGCVILLWQVAHQEAEQQTARAAESRLAAETEAARAEQSRLDYERASKEVLSASSEVSQLRIALAASKARAGALTEELDQRQREQDKTRTALELTQDLAKQLRAELADLKDLSRKASAELTRTNTDLAAKEKLALELRDLLAATERKLKATEKTVAAQQNAADETARRLLDQVALLRDSEGRNKKLEREVVDLRGEGKDAQAKLSVVDLRLKLLEQELERSKKELADSGQRFKDLMASHQVVSQQLVASARDLGAARATLANLEGDKHKLEGEAAKLLAKARALQAAAEQRFAGIELNGENVIFMIDMSGSMELIDSQTRDPDKWPKVCEVVARLMRSLSGLQRYQVILFSSRSRYLFGHDGQWLKYDPASSAQVTHDALRRVKPAGETNLHLPMAEAFRFRPVGLDTIYLLSDGLPNAGDGLPANADQLPDSQRTELLSRHLRQKLRGEWNRPLPDQAQVRIHTIGFFFESPDVGAFLWALAREHDGSFVGMSKP
jgi:hypothetical protein